MKKRLLSMMLVATLAMSLCACGSKENPKTESKAESQPTSTQSSDVSSKSEELPEEYVPTYPIVDEEITVTGVVVGMDTSVSESRIVWDLVEEVTGINIEWINVDADAAATLLAGGEWPDFFHNIPITATEIYDYGVLGGRFVNYFDYLDVMPNLKQALDDFPIALAASTEENGEMYHLFQVGGVSATSTTTRPHFLINVLKNAGIDKIPTTVDEFYDCLVALKDFYGQPSMILDSVAGNSGMPIMLFSSFGKLHNFGFDDDGTGKVIYGRTSEQMKHYYEFLNKLYEEELMHREWLTLDNTAKTQLVQSGVIAFPAGAQAVATTLDDLGGDWDNLGTLAPFTSEYDDTQTLPGPIDYRSAPGMYINKDSKYVEEICKMLDIAFATEEVVEGTGLYGQAFTYGLEGVDWNLNADGTYSQSFPEGQQSFSTYQAQELRWVDFGRADKWGPVLTSTPGNAQARQKGYTSNVIPYQAKENIFPTGLLRFTEDEQYILDNKYTDLDKYVMEMEAQFITGAADIDTQWDEYIANCEKMGLNDILDVYQKAYDRWVAALELE